MGLISKYTSKITDKNKFSKSENRGFSLLSGKNLIVYSPGISTGGGTEIKMAVENSKRKIIATTIDKDEIAKMQDLVIKAGLASQITVKYEDISEPLEYKNKNFDFIYARLLLHYLPKEKLDTALLELKRVLKHDGKLFVVVRSTLDPDYALPGNTYDPISCLTTYTWRDESGNFHQDRLVSRYFHTKDSITKHLEKAGFKIKSIHQYDEQLYLDFSRTKLSSIVGNLIEVVAEPYS